MFAVECWKIFLFFPLPYLRVNLNVNMSALGVKYELDKDFLLRASLCSLFPSLVQGALLHSQDPIGLLAPPFKPDLEAPAKSYYTYSITLIKQKWNIFGSPASFTFSDNFYLKLYNESEAEHGKVGELAPDLGAMALLLTLGKSRCDYQHAKSPRLGERQFLWPRVCSTVISGSCWLESWTPSAAAPPWSRDLSL